MKRSEKLLVLVSNSMNYDSAGSQVNAGAGGTKGVVCCEDIQDSRIVRLWYSASTNDFEFHYVVVSSHAYALSQMGPNFLNAPKSSIPMPREGILCEGCSIRYATERDAMLLKRRC